MFKSEERCKGEGCDSYYIQNKKKHLCNDCVFKLNHDGNSKQEVYSERNNKKLIPTEKKLITAISEIGRKNIGRILQKEIDLIGGDEEGRRNAINQEQAVEEAKRELEEEIEKRKKSKKKPVKLLSVKQAEINAKYKIVCIDMDYTTEPVCTGCLRYQGGNIKLSHSHIISRADCKVIGKPELIYNRECLTYHCMDFGENVGCHRKWENPKERKQLKDYEQNIVYIAKVAPELLSKYKVD